MGAGARREADACETCTLVCEQLAEVVASAPVLASENPEVMGTPQHTKQHAVDLEWKDV